MASVWSELKRRNVVKVAMAYAIVGWLLIEIASTVLPTFDAPQWVLQTITFVIVLGFPLALVFAWAFELTPEGIKREEEVERAESITRQTGQKLNYVIIGLLVLAVGFMAVDNYILVDEEPAPIALGEEPTEVSQRDTPAAVSSKSIAVLPFANASASASAAEGNAEFLADGLHSEVITQLSRISSLKVISRTSVMEYRDTPKNLREIGGELIVTTILEGDVRQAGNQVRIDVKLINAETDQILWGEIYSRELTVDNLFDVQRDMALRISDALQATLTPEEVVRLDELPTQNSRAYDFYLSGLDFSSRPGESNALLAIQQFERAIVEDPTFALAYARLSISNEQMIFGFESDRTPDRLDVILTNAQQALELQPDLPEAHMALGLYYYAIYDYDRALEQLDIAMQGLPGDPEIFAFQGFVLRRSGQWESAVAALTRAVDLDPRNASTIRQLGRTYTYLRNYTAAAALFDRALDIRPDEEVSHWRVAQIPMYLDGDVEQLKAFADTPGTVDGVDIKVESAWRAALYDRDYDLALPYLDEWEAQAYDSNFFRPKSSYYGQIYQRAGQMEVAIPYLEEARAEIEQLLERDPEDHRYHVAMAEVLAGLGDSTAAVQFAEQAMDLMPQSTDRPTGGRAKFFVILNVYGVIQDDERLLALMDDYLGQPNVYSIEGFLPHPSFDFIRDDPRFVALVEKYRRR